MKRVKSVLTSIAAVLESHDHGSANELLKLKSNTPQKIADNIEIWGGSGSLMDQAIYGERGEARREFESRAIELGEALIEAGAKNQRMENWVNVFKQWAEYNV